MRTAWLGLLCLGWAATAQAGNLDSYYMSSEAALQAGAITADATGGAAIWYNPAGLSTIAGLRFDVSASAFRLSLGAVPDLRPQGSDAELTRLTTVNVLSVPSSLTLSHRFGDVALGLGVFVPTLDGVYLRSQLRGQTPLGNSELGLDLHTERSEYFVGPGVGWLVTPGLSMGASLLGLYRNELTSTLVEANVDLNGDGIDAAIFDHETDDWQQLGVQLVYGMQLRPDRDWAAGVTVRLPTVRLFQMHQTVSASSATSSAGTEVNNTFREVSGFDSLIMAPARVHLGLSHRRRAWRFSADANYQLPYSGEGAERSLLAVANLRLGASRELTPTLRVGGGLFSDRSPVDAELFNDRALDYYGLTIAGDLTTPYRTVQKGKQVFAAPRPLAFSTGVALSYAVGVGDIVRADVTSMSDGGLDVREQSSHAVAHELILHIASSFGE